MSTIDNRAFRQTVGQFATGVTFVGTEIDGTIRAMTANSFTALSIGPPLVLFCIGKATKMGQAMRRAAGFSVAYASPLIFFGGRYAALGAMFEAEIFVSGF